MRRHKAKTKAISPLPSLEGPSCCLLGNLSCRGYLSCSRCPPPLSEVCDVGVPAGIAVLTVSEAMDAVAKWRSSFQARLSSVWGAWAKLIHAGHSLRPRKSKILEPALMAGGQPSSLSGGGAPACPWGRLAGGELVSRRRDAGRQGGRTAGEGQAAGTGSSVHPAPRSWQSCRTERKAFHFTP